MKRNFDEISAAELEQLAKPKFARQTEYCRKSIKTMFLDYLKTKDINGIPNDKKQLDSLLSSFWPSLKKVDGTKFRASTMKVHRQNLRSVLSEDNNIDIFTDYDFKNSHNIFNNNLALLKEQGLGYVKHHADITKDDMKKIVESLDTNNNVELQWLSWLFVMLFYCRRGIENLSKMEKNHFVVSLIDGQPRVEYIYNERTKNHRETNESIESGGVLPHVRGNSKSPAMIFYTYFQSLNKENIYLWQRPNPLFLQAGQCWYQNKKQGLHTLSTMMKAISQRCSIEAEYTNHSIRAATCTLLGEIGYSDLDVQAISQHKSVNALGIYKRVKIDKKNEMAINLAKTLGIDQPSCSTNNHATNIVSTTGSQQTVPVMVNSNDNDSKLNNTNNNVNISDLPEISAEEISRIMEPYESNPVNLQNLFRPVFYNCSDLTINFNNNK